jgi:hypothetical protein
MRKADIKKIKINWNVAVNKNKKKIGVRDNSLRS